MRPTTLALTAALGACLLASTALGQGGPTPSAVSAAARQQGGPPTGIAAATLWDHGAGGLLKASSTPGLGKLYPLSSELYVDAATGRVGIGTLAPAAELDVVGRAVVGEGLLVGPASAVYGLRTSVLAGTEHLAESDDCAIGAGHANLILGQFSERSFIGAGTDNEITGFSGASTTDAFIGAGAGNEIDDSGGAFVGGGLGNSIRGGSLAGAIAGGTNNVVRAPDAAVPGGRDNEASGAHSLAAGSRAKARHQGTFAWADSTPADFVSTDQDQFLVRAAGGVGIGTNAPTAQLEVAGGVRSSGPTGGSFLAYNPLNQGASLSLNWLNDQARIRIGGSGPGVSNGFEIQRVGDGMIMHVSDQGDVTAKDQMFATGFVQTSDARLTTDVRELDGGLDAVRRLRGVRFQWDREQRPEAEQGERIGFLAQEVRAVVPEAVREREDGTLAVAYAELVPVLVEALQEQDRRIAELEARLAE